MQNILIASDDYKELDEYFAGSGAKNILLVCDSAYGFLKIKDYFDTLQERKGIKVVKFSDFQPNPLYESVVEGVKVFHDNKMIREEIIQHIVKATGEDPIVSTTGKPSRELFETRVANGQSHKYDFLTVGSMGHTSSIALGIAINKPNQRIWCVDGDGAVLMHMGSMAVLGANKPKNIVHVVINNGAHETVGGMPTVAAQIDLVGIAKACGYPNAVCVDNFDDLDKELEAAKSRNELSLIEVKCSIGARDDLGRPTTTALENKHNFMEYIKTIK